METFHKAIVVGYLKFLPSCLALDVRDYSLVTVNKGNLKMYDMTLAKRLRPFEVDSVTEEGVKELLKEFLTNKIIEHETKLINWLNTAGAYNIYMHKLDLLEGIGKKLKDKILTFRSISPFISYDDFYQRTKIDFKTVLLETFTKEILAKTPILLYILDLNEHTRTKH